MIQHTAPVPGESTASPADAPRTTTGLYVAGLVVTVLGAGYVAVDQIALGGLSQHLEALYAPYGKVAQPGPLYGYLYALAALGLLSWLTCLRHCRRLAATRDAADLSRIRVWSIVVAALAAFLVLPPLMITEYGRLVIPFGLGAAYGLAWLLGVAGIVTLPRRNRPLPTDGNTAE